MEQFKLSREHLSFKLLLTFAIIGMCFTYVVLASHIYIDTEFKVENIKEAYKTFEWIELVDQTHKYLPYYGVYIFAFALFIFVIGTRCAEWLKILMVVWINFFIFLDIGSMWAIRYINADIFSWALYFAGIALALSFGTIVLLSLYDIWLKKD